MDLEIIRNHLNVTLECTRDLVIVTIGTLSLTPFNLKAQCLQESFTGKKKWNQMKNNPSEKQCCCFPSELHSTDWNHLHWSLQTGPQVVQPGPHEHCQPCSAIPVSPFPPYLCIRDTSCSLRTNRAWVGPFQWAKHKWQHPACHGSCTFSPCSRWDWAQSRLATMIFLHPGVTHVQIHWKKIKLKDGLIPKPSIALQQNI